MASFAEFLSMPLSGGPNARPFGVDELGNTAFRGVLGPDYRVVQQAPNRESVVRGLLSQIMDAPGATLANLAKGAAQGTWDAISAPGRSWSDSTMTYGDVANTAGLVSLPAVAGKYDPAVANMGIRAYHGSPHDFDRFDMSKIGTGEGAQAYGHGLYFAESEGVARSYRDALRKSSIDGRAPDWDNPRDVASYWAEIYGGPEGALDYLRKTPSTDPVVPAAIDLLERGDELGRPVWDPGHMYEVDINADPADFLDWDAPLSEQSPAVKAAANKIANSRPDAKSDLYQTANEPGWGFYSVLGDKARTGDIVRNQTAATEALREAGIPGIKYYDQGSRAGKEGTRNYVVFDDSLIEILRKYGLAGAMLGFGAYPQENTQ